MAERPLYTLYKNLKAQNYDVPDDYNKFESALTRDGKGGADNRHAIYENLKAQNFDVPSTYERFYSALFEPRSKTSSRAKGGSVPMTAADRARFSAGAQAISASAQQTMNNTGRYNRLKQRKQKQQNDFGRVNLGTHKTPYGGDANNVVKDDFAYNPETGKAGAYVTSDNENAYTQNDAEQKQNLLDKYGEEWNNAVDMGVVPSELDKADPDLSDTDVAMRQMERRQEWLDENQNRRSKELNESMHLQGSPFVASGGAVVPSSFNTAISNEANRLSDVEYGAYNTAKAYNLMLRTTLLQELKEQKQRNENAGWWKDKWNDVSNYFGAMFNTMLDPKLYSQGVMDAAIANNVLQVKKGMEDGTIKKGSNAGNAAQAMLGAIQQQQGEAAKQQQYGTKAYQYGDMSGRSLKFMADFALSGWRNVMTTGFTKAGEKVGEKMALGALGKWFTKNTGRVLGDIAGSAALAATNQLGSTYNNVIERYVGMNNENGGVTQDKNGDLKFNEGVSLGKAIKDGFGSATIENFSEMFGEYLPGAPKLLSKLGLSKVSSFFEKIGNNAYYKWLSNATNKSGIQGVLAEISEEEFGTALHAAWGDGDGSWSDFNVFTNPDAREKQIDTCLGMFYSVGFMQAPRTAVGAINAVQYFNIKHQVAKADKFGQVMFNDKWEEIKSKIDVTTNADLTKTILDATRSDSMTAKQKGAVINYAMFLSKLRGFNQAADAKTKDKVEEGDTAPTLSNDLDDAYTEGHNADDSDKHNIQLEQNDKANELAAMLHITPEQLHDMADEDLEAMTGQNDKLDQAIYDYQVSTAKYQGVMDGAQDEVDMAAHQAAMETDNMTDLSRGTVRKATIKATGGLEDYEVYIISGNIATHDDGSIDVGNSDDMIIYYDPTTGRKEHADAMMFADLIEELPAADVKAQAIIDAKENAIKKVAGIIDGTVEVGSQFSVTDADGTEHTYEVLADNGDGTAMITIDGNVPTELVKGENVQIPYSFADLQQMKDAEDLKRLEAAKAEREQMENERSAKQTQETQQTEESQPSFDFTQILNDNGNVVLADVLGKDGNTKYPNSQLFLIRDSGAKAKVMELTSDGSLIPHAVNKKDLRTATTMTLDEYKQAFAATSMIEDNSGTIEVDRGGIEVDDNTQPLSEADADNVIAQMESSAEVVPELELTPDNWAAEFGEDGVVSTPIGDVKMGENQVAKLFEKGRSKEFGMIKPTLTNPDVIIEVPSHSADGSEERSSSYLFIKTFLGKNGKKVYYFKSVTIKKDGLEISISSHYDRAKRVKEALMKGKLLYRKNDGAQTEQNQPSTSVTTSQEDAAGSSESKDTNISTNSNENNESLTFEDGTPIPVDVNGEVDLSQTDAAHAAEWYDTNLGEDADDYLDGEIKKAKKVLEQAHNKKVTGTKPSELVASKKEKEAAIADAQAHYDSAIAIRDAYNERQLAKVEDTAEGRKNLIDKARRKFARLKSAVKDDAEAVAQLYKETVGTLLHRLYDGTGIDVTDTIPLTAEEYVASNLGAHSLNYEGTETSKGVKQETGLSREDFAKTQLLAADGKGTTIDALVHSLWENRPSNLESLGTQEIRNAMLSVITSGFKASEAKNYIENLRIAQAEDFLEEQKKAADNAAFAEENKDENINEQTNENINDNINSLTPEQQKAKEDGEKLGFPAVDKEGEPINQYVIELANWAKEQGLEIDPTSEWTNYADLFIMCKDGFGVGTLVPDRGESINQVVYFPDNVQDFDQLWKLHEEFNVGRDLKHSADMDNEQTQGAMFYDGDTAREFKEFVDKKVEEQNKVFGEQRPDEDLPFSAKENGKQQTTAERAADVEKNKVDDVKVVDNIVGEKTRKAFERLAKMMGANIQWQYSDKLGNGWIQETKDADGNVHRTIFITLDSSITEGAQFIFGHEMTHQIKNLNPAAYNELTQLVLDTYGSDAFDKAVDETMQRYSDAGFSGRARDYYAEEVVADAVGEMIRDLNLAHTLAMKMSHPLLAAIHEILQKIKLAFYGTEYSDVTKNIIRSIEQAYVKTANGQVTNSETGEDVSYSLRQKPEPKKKGIGYKVFVLKDGKLYPPMVANPDGAATPVGVWLDADAAPIAGESKTGRPQVKQGGKGTQGGSGKLAYRPGWHLGVVPYAIQFNRKDAEGNKTLFPKNFVFAEVEYAADVDYQEEARQEGINPSGKYQHSLAGLKHLPTDGYYMYRTNPNPETDPWVITGAMKVNRILTRAEQADLVSKAGREPQQIQEGDIVTDDVVNSINQEIAAAPKFSLKVYHGSGADFTEFDFDHMGEGAGSQTFGWGGYVTSSKKIGKSYANLVDANAPHQDVEYVGNNAHEYTDVVAGLFNGGQRDYDDVEEFLQNGYNADKQNARKKQMLEWFESTKPSDWKSVNDGKRNLYEVDIPDDNGSNYLDFENPMSEEQINTIREALAKNGVDVPSWEKRGFKLDLPFKDVYAAVLPMMMRCEPKEVSKFLSSLGYTGIKYPAGTIHGGAEEGDTNYVIFKPEDMKITEHTKFSIKTYHGSQASFDKFDHSFMGSGEGAQAYGWGTYVSEVEGIAKAYAKQNAAKHGMPREYKIAQTRLNHAKFEYDKVQRAYDNSKAYIDSLKEDLQNYKESLARRKEKVSYFAQNDMPETVDKLLKQIKRTEETIRVTENDINQRTSELERWKPKLEEVKKKYEEEQKKFDAIPKPQIERNLYSVDIPDDTGENYIGWDEKMTPRMRDIRKEILEDNGYKLVDSDEVRDYFEDRDGKEYELFKEKYKTGGTFYEELAKLLHSQKLASLALKEYGFVGVKVIAQRNTGGNKEGKMNYVIFDENNAQITSHTKFSLKDPFKMSDNEKKERGDRLIKAPAIDVASGVIQKTADLSARKAAEMWWSENVEQPLVFNTEVGDVVIDEKSIKDSLAHRYNQAKLDSITSLPAGFGNSVYIGTISDFVRTRDNVQNHYFAYPINYDGQRNYVFCRAMQDTNKNRLYVHEVFVADKINEGNTLQTAASKPHGGIALYKEILANVLSAAKIDNSSETTKKNGEKVEVEEPKTFEEFLNHPSLKFSIKNEEQRKAAEDAYEYASKLRPNKYAQYALVDMSNPLKSPEYYEKKVLADRWRRFYNKAVHNELDDVYKDAWGNYKLFDLDRPFADQVNEVKGDVPSEFNAPDVVANKNADNESGAEYHEYKQGGLSSVTYEDRYKAFKQREANREKVAGLKKELKETEDSYNLKGKERAEYNKQLMKEYMDKHKMTEEYEIPDDVWDDLRSKSLEKYQDELDSLFNKYKDLDRQIKAVAEPRFSLKDEKTLAGVHNITEEKLLKAIKLGGLANPSVAVIDSSKQNHEDYGDISLILPSDKVAKRTGKNAGTWQGDAWTPTYPQVERQMSNKGAEKASKDVASVPNDMYSEVRRGLDRWLDGGEPNSAMAYMFLHEKGVAPEPKNIQHKYSDEAYNELKTITTGDFNIYGIGKSDAQKVLDMYIEAKFDGDKALYEEKTKAWLERNKAIVDTGTQGGMRYAIAKENVELYDEYGFNYKGVQTFVRDVEYDHRKTGVDMNATLNEVEDYINTNNLTDEFNTWLDGKEKEYGIKEVIFDGFTPSGNRRYVPNTLENVSKIMKKQGRNGATGTSVSFQNFAAKLMPSYGTLKDIRSKKNLLTSDHEDLDKFNEKWANVFFELGMKCQPDATGTFDDYGLARLSEAAMTSDPQAYLKKEYNVDFSDEDTKRLKEMVKAIKEEYPAMYFETKFERPVGFDEFSSAVVPTTASNEVKQALQNAGVQIYEYDKEKEGDRSRAFNEAINSSDNIRFSLKSMMAKPEGWKQANKKAIHIAEAIERDPKFSLKNLDGTLIKAGTYFSGGGLVEEGLKGIIDPVVAVEYDEKISGVYRNNFGQHIVTADVRDVDPKELVKHIDGEVEYFHASPVCKNYSQAKSNHAEVELDKETAASTAEFINAVKPKVVTIENVKGYKDSEAMKTITDALDANGYTWDADVYNAADYGGYTNRERLIVRAVRDGNLPEKPKKMAHKNGWYEAVADIIPTLTEKKNGVAPWMDIRLKADGIDWRNIDKPLYVMGSAYADGKVPHAFADELLPTLRTKSGDVIVMPDGKVYRAMGRVLARVSGVSDDYKMPFSENLSHTIIGNGIPTQLTEHVIAPLLQNTLRPTTPEDGNTRFSLRYDQFEHDLNQWKKDNNLPKDAQRPTIPQRNAGESAVDFLKRVDEYRKQMALWKTAPTYEQHLLSDDTALGEFNRELQRGSVLKRIAFQDSMLAIRKAQEAIMKEVGVERLNMAEDAYTAENRSHGKGKNEFEEYNNEFLQPLRKAYHQMKKILGDSYDNVRIYMMAKHGLERDAQMAFKKSLDADFEDVAQRSAAYRAYKGDMNRITNDSDLEFGRVDFNTWRQRDNALRTKYSPSYMDYRYDENGIAYDYSGLSALFGGSDFEEAAHKLVRDIESSHVAEVQDLWNATNAATKKILRDGYKAGMMSKDTYLYVRDMYSHYIPLRGWDGTTADQVWDYVGGGKGAFNQTLKTAHGRTSIADDPIAYIENMAESGILLNNKNWVKQHLMLLAQNHPTSLLTLSKAWYVKSTDANGNEEWIPATPQITSQMNSNQVKAAIDAFEKKMEQMAQTGDATQKRDGLNIAYPQTHSEEREHEVRVMKDGEEYVIYVNGDPQLAQAMNNTRAHRVREIQSGKLDRAAAWLGRKMAAAYTSLSPLFIPSNYFRDLTMTLASTAIREDGRYNYLLIKNMATSWNLGFMLRDYQNGKLREKVSNGNATPKEQIFYDFMMNGGETGFVSSLDVEDLKKKFKNDLKDLDRWKANPVKVGHTIMDAIEFLNRAIEDSNRFAIYMTSIQYGRSIDEAVNDAKDVTLNFNRKGTGEYGWQMVRNLYLFINPAVQSLQTLGALAKHHPFKFTAVTASWLASGVLVPVVNAALMSMLGGDDDKDKYWQFTKWDRRNNLIMWIPFTHEYVKIPLAQEFRAFYGIGDMIASKMMGGELAEESWSQYGEDLLGQVVDMLPLDPTGYDGNIAVSLMPNAIRPVFELAFNVDFTGKPLFKDTEYNKYDPNFTKAYVGTPDWLVRASKMVNSIGNDYPDVQQNSIDAFGDPRYNLNNPAVVDHVLSSYLGGAYTMGSQVLGVLTKALNDPKEIKVADIPLFSKFVSNPDDRPVTKKQGDEFWNMKENHDRAANTLSKLKKQAKVDGDYSMLERFYGSEEYKQYKQDDVKVKKYEEDKKKERAEESGEEYRPHKLNAEDIYKAHATPKDDFEDLKLKQLFTKLNGFKTSYDLLLDTAPSQSDGYYNTNKAAIDAIDEISLDKQEISELKKGFLDDGKDAYNAEDMKRIRELRKNILAVLEKANKVVVANQKAKTEK